MRNTTKMKYQKEEDKQKHLTALFNKHLELYKKQGKTKVTFRDRISKNEQCVCDLSMNPLFINVNNEIMFAFPV